jgi:multiple sugar transport system permease protein
MATARLRSTAARREAWAFHLFISPWIIGFLVFTLFPVLASLALSFTKYNIAQPPVWIGLKNYRNAVTVDPTFFLALRVTWTYALASIPLQLVLGLIIALMLNADIPLVSVWRTLYYLPSVLSGVAVAVLWALIFHPSSGILNNLLAIFGIKGPLWLFSKQWALPALIIMSLWGVGGSMIIYLSALQGVPTTLYEAATIDGAGAWRRFWNVTLPMITPVLLFNLIMGIISTLQSFTSAFVMTQGGPEGATLFFGLKLYYTAFRDIRMGYASMMAWVLFIIILVLTMAVVKSSSAWVYYEGTLKR